MSIASAEIKRSRPSPTGPEAHDIDGRGCIAALAEAGRSVPFIIITGQGHVVNQMPVCVEELLPTRMIIPALASAEQGAAREDKVIRAGCLPWMLVALSMIQSLAGDSFNKTKDFLENRLLGVELCLTSQHA